jgi:hypothetical protein
MWGWRGSMANIDLRSLPHPLVSLSIHYWEKNLANEEKNRKWKSLENIRVELHGRRGSLECDTLFILPRRGLPFTNIQEILHTIKIVWGLVMHFTLYKAKGFHSKGPFIQCHSITRTP